MASYRYYNIKLAGDEQVDIGGFFPAINLACRLRVERSGSRLVRGCGTDHNITNNTTNDFHYSWLRNWWSGDATDAPPQIAGLGGALELDSGQSETQDLGPFNVDNQQIRRRFWDGHDQMFRDDLSMLKGNHLLQFGGHLPAQLQFHQRSTTMVAASTFSRSTS